jgi:hypothetical protein
MTEKKSPHELDSPHFGANGSRNQTVREIPGNPRKLVDRPHQPRAGRSSDAARNFKTHVLVGVGETETRHTLTPYLTGIGRTGVKCQS